MSARSFYSPQPLTFDLTVVLCLSICPQFHREPNPTPPLPNLVSCPRSSKPSAYLSSSLSQSQPYSSFVVPAPYSILSYDPLHRLNHVPQPAGDMTRKSTLLTILGKRSAFFFLIIFTVHHLSTNFLIICRGFVRRLIYASFLRRFSLCYTLRVTYKLIQVRQKEGRQQ